MTCLLFIHFLVLLSKPTWLFSSSCPLVPFLWVFFIVQWSNLSSWNSVFICKKDFWEFASILWACVLVDVISAHAWLSMLVELQYVCTHNVPDLSILEGVANPFEWQSQIHSIHRMYVMVTLSLILLSQTPWLSKTRALLINTWHVRENVCSKLPKRQQPPGQNGVTSMLCKWFFIQHKTCKRILTKKMHFS